MFCITICVLCLTGKELYLKSHFCFPFTSIIYQRIPPFYFFFFFFFHQNSNNNIKKYGRLKLLRQASVAFLRARGVEEPMNSLSTHFLEDGQWKSLLNRQIYFLCIEVLSQPRWNYFDESFPFLFPFLWGLSLSQRMMLCMGSLLTVRSIGSILLNAPWQINLSLFSTVIELLSFMPCVACCFWILLQ